METLKKKLLAPKAVTKALKQRDGWFKKKRLTMAASVICSIHINERVTTWDHDEVIKKHEMFLSCITSSLKWNLFFQEKKLPLDYMKYR